MAPREPAIQDPSIEYIFHHVFMPPNLPHSDDFSEEREKDLLRTIIDGLAAFQEGLESTSGHHDAIHAATSLLSSTHTVHLTESTRRLFARRSSVFPSSRPLPSPVATCLFGPRKASDLSTSNDFAPGLSNMIALRAEKVLEAEAQSLGDRYRPRQNTNDISIIMPNITGRLVDIEKRCLEFKRLQYDASTLQEEKEREHAREMEQERQVQRPPAMKPAPQAVHPLVQHFINTGKLIAASQPFLPAFKSLLATSAAADLSASQILDEDALLLAASADFVSTIDRGRIRADALDSYQLPVQ